MEGGIHLYLEENRDLRLKGAHPAPLSAKEHRLTNKTTSSAQSTEKIPICSLPLHDCRVPERHRGYGGSSGSVQDFE